MAAAATAACVDGGDAGLTSFVTTCGAGDDVGGGGGGGVVCDVDDIVLEILVEVVELVLEVTARLVLEGGATARTVVTVSTDCGMLDVKITLPFELTKTALS